MDKVALLQRLGGREEPTANSGDLRSTHHAPRDRAAVCITTVSRQSWLAGRAHAGALFTPRAGDLPGGGTPTTAADGAAGQPLRVGLGRDVSDRRDCGSKCRSRKHRRPTPSARDARDVRRRRLHGESPLYPSGNTADGMTVSSLNATYPPTRSSLQCSNVFRNVSNETFKRTECFVRRKIEIPKSRHAGRTRADRDETDCGLTDWHSGTRVSVCVSLLSVFPTRGRGESRAIGRRGSPHSQ
jgi:hypothetical protein